MDHGIQSIFSALHDLRDITNFIIKYDYYLYGLPTPQIIPFRGQTSGSHKRWNS